MRTLLRAGIALLIAMIVAGAGVFVFLRVQFDRVVQVDGPLAAAAPLLSPAREGRPAVALIIGTDRGESEQGGAPGPIQADTLLLVRVDPAARVISALDVPRTERVDLEGGGRTTVGRLYGLGGPRLTLQAVERLTRLELNFLVVVDFDGFRKIVDAFGGIYLDVDHTYEWSGEGVPVFEPIHLPAGYQMVDGEQALAFARDRHADSDAYRLVRQLMVVRELRRLADGIGTNPVGLFEHLADALSVAQAVGGSARVAAGGGALTFGSALAWARAIQTIPEDRMVTVPVPSSDPGDLATALRTFVDPLALPDGAPVATPVGPGNDARAGGPAGGTVRRDPRYALDAFRDAQDRVGFRILYPTVSVPGSRLEPLRVYTIETGDGTRGAVRATFRMASGPDYWGIEETAWTDPPILGPSTRTEERGGRTLRLYYDGPRLHMVAFQEGEVVYWVSNSLFDSLTNATMLAIAGSLEPPP